MLDFAKINIYKEGMKLFKEEPLNDEITKEFLLLMHYTQYKNKKRRHTDPNRIVEGYFAKLFNNIFNSNFKVCDLITFEDGTNTDQPAIDLIEDRKKIAIQVTSDNSIDKIKHTINQFNKEGLDKKYNDLYVLIINTKKKYRNIKSIKKDCKTKGYNLHIVDIYDLIDIFILAEDVIKQKVHKFNEKYLSLSLKEIIQDDFDNEYSIWEYAGAFIEHLEDASEGYIIDSKLEEYLENLKNFVIKLSKIPITTRKLLFKIINNNISYDVCEGVVFDSIKVQKKSGLDIDDFRNEVIILQNEGFKIWDLEEYNRYRISYDITEDCYDILSELLTFCNDYEVSLKKLIVDLEFDLLD